MEAGEGMPALPEGAPEGDDVSLMYHEPTHYERLMFGILRDAALYLRHHDPVQRQKAEKTMDDALDFLNKVKGVGNEF